MLVNKSFTYYLYIKTDIEAKEFLKSIELNSREYKLKGDGGFKNSRLAVFKDMKGSNKELTVENYSLDGIPYIKVIEKCEGNRDIIDSNSIVVGIMDRYKGMLVVEDDTRMYYVTNYGDESKEDKLIREFMSKSDNPLNTFILAHRVLESEKVVREILGEDI